jgi:hypothetical protein
MAGAAAAAVGGAPRHAAQPSIERAKGVFAAYADDVTLWATAHEAALAHGSIAAMLGVATAWLGEREVAVSEKTAPFRAAVLGDGAPWLCRGRSPMTTRADERVIARLLRHPRRLALGRRGSGWEMGGGR